MRISVRLFASYREIVGKSQMDLDVAEGTTVAGLLDLFVGMHPRLRDLAYSSLFAVNREYVSPEAELREGDEVVFVPPVSGGEKDV